jgi:hypothetical protein
MSVNVSKPSSERPIASRRWCAFLLVRATICGARSQTEPIKQAQQLWGVEEAGALLADALRERYARRGDGDKP